MNLKQIIRESVRQFLNENNYITDQHKGEINKHIPSIEHDLKIGDSIVLNIFGKIENGVVTDVGYHKGQIVIDFKDSYGDERFAYARQIVSIKHNPKKLN